MRVPPRSPSRQRGSVAILALWGLAIVFVLLAAASFTTRSELQIARNELAAVRAHAAAEAGTQLGLAHLLARRARGTTLFDGTPEIWQDGPVRVVIAIADEAGKIDLNQAPPEFIAGLFVAVGQAKETAFLIACRVVARRGGAAPDCPEPRSAGPEPQSAFAAPEELAALPGVGDRLYAQVADFVTVATGASAIDPAVAPRTVLLALPGATPELVEGWLAERQMEAEMSPEGSLFEALPDFPYLMVSPMRDFTVSAVATGPEGARARADLQLRLTRVASHPYDVLAFRSPPLAPPGRR
jgi:general secretion pathway protein K